MRGLVSIAGACALMMLLVAGCGSSSPAGGAWVVAGTTHDGKATFGLVGGTVAWPSQVQVTVETNPSTTATTHYTVVCGAISGGDGITINRNGPTGTTPLTFKAPLPAGGPGECLFRAGATYRAKVDSTLTVRQSPVQKK